MPLQKRTLVLSIVIVALVGALIGGCAPAAPTPTPMVEKITLQLWWINDQPEQIAWMEESAALFQKKYPNITVKTVVQTMDSLYPAFTASAKAGIGPDMLMLFPGTWTLGEVWAGHLAPIGDYLTKEELAHFFPGCIAGNTFNGKVWALTSNTGAQGMVYNKELFAKAGLDPENPPTTWDAFLAACDKLRAAGITPVAFGSKGMPGKGNFIGMFLPQGLDQTGEVLLPVVGKASWTEEKYSGWLKQLKEAIDRRVFNDDVTSLGYFEGVQLVPAGQAAIAICDIGSAVRWNRELKTEKFAPMIPPSFGKGKAAGTLDLNTWGWALASYSPHLKEAANFLKFLLLDPERVNALAAKTGALSATDLIDVSVLPDKAAQLGAKLMREHPGSMWWQDYVPIEFDQQGMRPVIDQMFAGTTTPEKGAQFIQDYAVTWREKNPDLVKNLEQWATGLGLIK